MEIRNKEGYIDLTAAVAIENAAKAETELGYEAGMIVEAVGANKKKTYNALLLKKQDKFFSAVVLYDEQKESTTDSIYIPSVGKCFYNCSITCYVYFDAIKSLVCEIEENLLNEVKEKMVVGLGLDYDRGFEMQEINPDIRNVVVSDENDYKVQIIKLQAECDAYKNLCLELMKRSA